VPKVGGSMVVFMMAILRDSEGFSGVANVAIGQFRD
jgi:hypothetical protein